MRTLDTMSKERLLRRAGLPTNPTQWTTDQAAQAGRLLMGAPSGDFRYVMEWIFQVGAGLLLFIAFLFVFSDGHILRLLRGC